MTSRKRDAAESILLDNVPLMRWEEAEKFVALVIDAAKEELRAETFANVLSPAETGKAEGGVME